jgi:dihydropteroate synthase
VPVLKRLRDKLTIPISVDTYKSGVAKAALDYGVEVINDPSGLTLDPLLAKVVVQYDAGIILNHMRGTPEFWAKLPTLKDAVGAMMHDLGATINRARLDGLEKSRIMVDPGLGFGKRKEQNLEILARLPEMARLDFPILVGPSRKAFLRQNVDDETEFATAAAVTFAIMGGAHRVRVHAVREMWATVQVADAIMAAIPVIEPEERPERPSRN